MLFHSTFAIKHMHISEILLNHMQVFLEIKISDLWEYKRNVSIAIDHFMYMFNTEAHSVALAVMNF
jgi:hypothetical protein